MLTTWLSTALLLPLTHEPTATGDATRVATLNIAEVFDKYEMTRDLEAQFERQRQATAEKAQARRDEMEAKRRALIDQFKPDTREYEERRQQLESMEVEYQVWIGVEEKKLKNDHKRWLMGIYRNVRDQVKTLADARGIDVVLTYDQLTDDAPDSVTLRQQILLQKVIYSSTRADITAEVVTRLNDDYQKRGGAASMRLGGDAAGAPATPAATPVPPPGTNKK